MERGKVGAVGAPREVLVTKPITNGQQLLREVWYGVGKAVESQTPAAWNERIIRTINTKIIPKLTPEQHQTLYRYKKPIEVAATAAGIGISTVEMIAAVVAFRWGVTKLRSLHESAVLKKGLKKINKYKAAEYVPLPVKWATHPDSLLEPAFEKALQSAYADPLAPWERSMNALFREKFPKREQDALRFSITMKRMAEQMAENNRIRPAWEATMHFALGGKKPEALVRVREQFVNAFVEATRAFPDMRGLSDDARRLFAGEAFRVWADEFQFRGLEDLFFRSQQTERVPFAVAKKAAVRLGGHRMPITLDEILAAYQSATSGGPVPFEQALGDRWWETGQSALWDMQGHEKKMAEIGRRIDKKLGITRKDPKPDTHRFLDRNGHIIRPGSVPAPVSFQESVRQAVDENIRQFVAKRDGKIRRIHDTAAQTPQKIRKTVDRVTTVRNLGTPEIRLHNALVAGFSPNEPVTSASHGLLESLLLQVQMHRADPNIQTVLGKLGKPESQVPVAEKTKLAASLFAEMFPKLSKAQQNTLGFAHDGTLFSTMSAKWVQEMRLAGLNVLTNRDIIEALTLPKKPIAEREVLSQTKQVEELIRAITKNFWRPNIAGATATVAQKGAWRQSPDGKERAGSSALYNLFHEAMEYVRPEQWEKFGAHDEISRRLIEDARKHGKGTTKYLAMELADWWVQHDAPGLSALYKRLRGKR